MSRQAKEHVDKLLLWMMLATDCKEQSDAFQSCTSRFLPTTDAHQSSQIVDDACRGQQLSMMKCANNRERQQFWTRRGMFLPQCQRYVVQLEQCLDKKDNPPLAGVGDDNNSSAQKRNSCDAQFLAAATCGLEHLLTQYRHERQQTQNQV